MKDAEEAAQKAEEEKEAAEAKADAKDEEIEELKENLRRRDLHPPGGCHFRDGFCCENCR